MHSEEEEDFGESLPAVLFRLHVPITTILASDDETVTLEGVQQWADLTNEYAHVEIEPVFDGDEEEGEERRDEKVVKKKGVCGGHNYLSWATNRRKVIECIRRIVENKIDG
jgi:hypothetical protein